MTREEAYDIARRVAEAFSTGDCRNLPAMQKIEEAAAVLAEIVGVSKPEMDRDAKGVAVLTKKMAENLKNISAHAASKECRDLLIEKVLHDDDDRPAVKRPRM